MAKSPRWSNGSAGCRLEWRPSRWLAGALGSLGVLSAFSALASEMPRAWAWPLALAALACGVWRARRELRKPARAWFWPGSGGSATVDATPVAELRLSWRGPLVFANWRDAAGRRHHASWWPDTLPAARRRELRLAAQAARASPSAASMAP